MLTQARASDIFARVKRHASGGEVEALIGSNRYALTRFANNTIHQNVAEESLAVSVRVAMDGKTARATTNKLDDDSLRRVVQAAEALARVQSPDPDLLSMATREEAGAADGSVPSRHFGTAAGLGPAERAEAVGRIVSVAKREKLTAAGVYASGESAEALVNSRGVAAFHQQTHAEVSVTMLGADSSGWQKGNSPDVAQIDPVALGETAARKARESAAPVELDPGKYTVILEPAAVLDLVGFLFYDFAGLAVLDQRSFLTGRVGSKLFGENITIWDDCRHRLQSGAPYDGEGVRRERVLLVEKGVARNLVYSRGTAAKMKKSAPGASVGEVRATGHGFPLPNEMGEAPVNIVFAPPAAGEARTVEEMIAATGRGILVTRLWYIREVDPYEKILTGMTRDGTFLIEGGRLRRGVRNFRFNQSLIAMLNGVEQMSEPVRASGEESFDMVVPAMKVKEFNFTEVTRF